MGELGMRSRRCLCLGTLEATGRWPGWLHCDDLEE